MRNGSIMNVRSSDTSGFYRSRIIFLLVFMNLHMNPMIVTSTMHGFSSLPLLTIGLALRTITLEIRALTSPTSDIGWFFLIVRRSPMG